MLPFILAVLLLLVPLVIYDIWQRDREFRRCKRSMPFTLKDLSGDPNSLGHVHGIATIGESDYGLEIQVMGYGDHHSTTGFGSPIFLEYYGGRLALIVHTDINDPEPTLIHLEKAREINRIEEEAEVN